MKNIESIEDFINLTIDEINSITKNDAQKLLDKFYPIAEVNREETINFFESRGIELPENFRDTSKSTGTYKSWQNVDFSYTGKERIGTLRGKLRELQRFFKSSKTTATNYKNFIKDFRTKFLEQSGAKYISNRIGSYKKWFDKSKKYWSIYNKVSELAEVTTSYSSSQVQAMIANVMQDRRFRNEEDILDEVMKRLTVEYERKQSERTPKFTTQSSFFDDEEGNY